LPIDYSDYVTLERGCCRHVWWPLLWWKFNPLASRHSEAESDANEVTIPQPHKIFCGYCTARQQRY
jgi:hypothetical protein